MLASLPTLGNRHCRMPHNLRACNLFLMKSFVFPIFCPNLCQKSSVTFFPMVYFSLTQSLILFRSFRTNQNLLLLLPISCFSLPHLHFSSVYSSSLSVGMTALHPRSFSLSCSLRTPLAPQASVLIKPFSWFIFCLRHPKP